MQPAIDQSDWPIQTVIEDRPAAINLLGQLNLKLLTPHNTARRPGIEPGI